MPLIVTRSPRTRQPQGAVGAGGAAGLVALLSPMTGEARSRTAAIAPGGYNRPSVVATEADLAWHFDSAAYTLLQAPSVPYVPPPLTVLLIARKSSAATEALVSFGGAGAGFGWKVGSYGSAASLNMTFGGIADYPITASGWTVGEVACYAVAVTETTAKAWRNGVYLGSASVGTPVAPTDRLTLGGANGGAADLSSSDIINVALFRRAMGDAEAAAASATRARQWELFAPIERRIWVPSASSAVPSITAVYADSVTASSVVPRVTLDFA